MGIRISDISSAFLALAGFCMDIVTQKEKRRENACRGDDDETCKKRNEGKMRVGEMMRSHAKRETKRECV